MSDKEKKPSIWDKAKNLGKNVADGASNIAKDVKDSKVGQVVAESADKVSEVAGEAVDTVKEKYEEASGNSGLRFIILDDIDKRANAVDFNEIKKYATGFLNHDIYVGFVVYTKSENDDEIAVSEIKITEEKDFEQLEKIIENEYLIRLEFINGDDEVMILVID